MVIELMRIPATGDDSEELINRLDALVEEMANSGFKVKYSHRISNDDKEVANPDLVWEN